MGEKEKDGNSIRDLSQLPGKVRVNGHQVETYLKASKVRIDPKVVEEHPEMLLFHVRSTNWNGRKGIAQAVFNDPQIDPGTIDMDKSKVEYCQVFQTKSLSLKGAPKEETPCSPRFDGWRVVLTLKEPEKE